MHFERDFYKKQILQDLKQKMVFLGGPRQVGKTTLATTLLPKEKYQYLNWDLDEDRIDISLEKASIFGRTSPLPEQGKTNA